AEASGGQREAAGLPNLPLPDYLDRVEREAITQALVRTGFNRTAAAKLLGVTFRALRYRMQRLDIREPDGQA
ncbi:MAG: sigma-54-dependent Fis family transcriptional regulator, partial [Proteobacteria bacterium]|nr:sigma-54-dependent Fis family transcriptional regulator [Pseudomonadota bacterium]